MFERSRSAYGAKILRKRLLKSAALAAVLVLTAGGAAAGIRAWNDSADADKRELRTLWDEGAYEDTLALSHSGLSKRPMDPVLLIVYGFSSYQLAMGQINTQDSLGYLDECIWSLRKALLTRAGAKDKRIPYVLGKAYFHKGSSYADLSVQYLELARESGYAAADLAEYLGLAYAALKDYRNSVIAFSRALEGAEASPSGPSDLLLLSMARSYIELGEGASAKAYIMRCIESSSDASVVVQARLLLGKLHSDAGESAEAERQYTAIVDSGEQSAEAHYQLGEIFAAAGDPVKARAEWRKSLRIDPSYGPARARLSL